MARRIVICLDGTLNKFGESETNVLRTYRCTANGVNQVTYYQPGVGTLVPTQVLGRARNVALTLLDAATAWMIERHVTSAYRWLMQQDLQGAELFVFGFSRGAYVARALCGMLHAVGLLRPGHEEMVPFAFAEYVNFPRHPRRTARFKKTFGRKVTIKFLGLWDTVSSYGTPWRRRVLPFTAQNRSVKVVRHAISIDERRGMFATNQWSEQHKGTDLAELWFAGMHSDVGGGAVHDPKQDKLSLIPFAWILREAESKGLQVDPRAIEAITKAPWDGVDHLTARLALEPMHDSMTFGWRLLEYVPIVRRIPVEETQLGPRLRRLLRAVGLERNDWVTRFWPNFRQPRLLPSHAALAQSVKLRMAQDPSYRPPNVAQPVAATLATHARLVLEDQASQ